MTTTTETKQKARAKAEERLAHIRARIHQTLTAPWFTPDPDNPFQVDVGLPGDWGTVTLRDPPALSSIGGGTDDNGDRGRDMARSLRGAFVATTGPHFPNGGREAPLKEWVDLLREMPTSVYIRLSDAVDAIGHEPESGTDLGE